MNLSQEEHAFIQELSEEQCKGLYEKLRAIYPVINAGYGSVNDVAHQCAEAKGVAVSTIHRWMSNYRRHGLRGLVDARGFSVAPGIPEKTAEFIRAAFLQANRDSSVEVRHLLIRRWALWKKGEQRFAIPGYETCPPDAGNGYPAGWSMSAFRRLRPPPSFTALISSASHR